MTSLPITNEPVARIAGVWPRISWGPIMMGAVCAIGLQLLFTVLGIAIGVSAADVSTDADGSAVHSVGVAAGVWWLVTGTIALAVGGAVFGWLSGLTRSVALQMEAATMWGVVALFGFLVMWSGADMASQVASPLAAVAARHYGASGDLLGRNGASPTASSDTSSSSTNNASTTTPRGDRANSAPAQPGVDNPANTASPASSTSPIESGTTGNANRADTSPSDSPDRASSSRQSDRTQAEATESAQRAARTASWWSVVALVIGLVATISAAVAAAPSPAMIVKTPA